MRLGLLFLDILANSAMPPSTFRDRQRRGLGRQRLKFRVTNSSWGNQWVLGAGVLDRMNRIFTFKINNIIIIVTSIIK